MKQLYLISFFLLFYLYSFSQDYSTTSKKAIKYFQKATYYYDNQIFNLAAENAFLAIDKDSNFVEAYLLLGEISYNLKNTTNEIKYFSKALEKDSINFPMTYYLLATSLMEIEKYDEAKPLLYKFLEKNTAVTYNEGCLKNIEICDFRSYALLNPVPYNPEKLPATINTTNEEYFPSITADGKTLIFTRLLPTNGMNPIVGDYQEDLFVSTFKDNNWTEAQSIGNQINDLNNQGAEIISADGTAMIYTDCTCDDGFIKCCDLYLAAYADNIWTKGIKLGTPINTAYWESQPCLSADGKTLYFVSNRNGGKGMKDIWKITKLDDGTWSTAINLGDSINTAGNEMGPFIHSDNKTFYFSSDGWTGMGGLDLFRSTINENKKFTTPKNLGYPINNKGNEFRLIIDAKGKVGYYSSEVEEANGQDIYKLELYPEIQPTKTIYVKGKIYDNITKEKLKANYEILNLETTKKENDNLDVDNFFICLPIENNYALNVSQKGYLFYSENFSLKNISDTINYYNLDVYLTPIKKGNKIILKNIFFETDSYNLKTESYVELNKLVEFLTQNKDLKIEIGGHTDNVGTEKYNQLLSENRAKTVVEYLITKGIASNRLTYKGYGLLEPITQNTTVEGRAQNRRTEFKIIE